jgi:integrase
MEDTWTFHWTRRSYATYSLAPKSLGGYGLELKTVQDSLGHADPATTQRTYFQKLPRDAEQLRALTSRPAGRLI